MSVYLGYIEYKVKIYEEIHLEEDPHFPCRTYSTAGEYDACLEAEYVRQTVDLMDCTPPWMTDSQEQPGPFSLVQDNRDWALIGRELQNDEIFSVCCYASIRKLSSTPGPG